MREIFARRSILSYCLGGASALLLASTLRSQAATMTFTADLKGSSEVPPNDTTGTGSVTVKLDTASHKITWNGIISGLSGPAAAAHIHAPAAAGKNAGVVVWLSTKGKPLPDSFSGSATLTAAQAKDLMDGQAYVNVHTKAHPGGEIRGQLVKS